MLKEIQSVSFPNFKGIMINMMPIIVGDEQSLPENIKPYQEMINSTSLKQGDIAYLTIRESVIGKNQSQGRGGIHVEAPKLNAWGGGGWGGLSLDKGIYMASNDGACRAWNEIVEERDLHGGCKPLTDNIIKMKPSTLYWMTDKTPHESLVSQENFKRQFFRLVSDEISLWFAQHNTPNPLGILPNCPITQVNKFLN